MGRYILLSCAEGTPISNGLEFQQMGFKLSIRKKILLYG